MSDTEDGTDSGDDADENAANEAAEGGDGFDKEAEREKLREKYERDQQRREATQQMSELLLQGATMTNEHCGECGSPIFRHDGEEFCPTCGGTRGTDDEPAGDDVDEGADVVEDEAAAGGSSGETEAGGERARGPARRPSEAADVDVRAAGSDAGGDGGGGSENRTSRVDRGSRGGDRDEPSRASAGHDRRTDPRTGERPTPPSRASPVTAGEVPSLAQTRASLRRAIVSLSEQAAQSDDPKRAWDLLKGSREGAEALAALRDVRE